MRIILFFLIDFIYICVVVQNSKTRSKYIREITNYISKRAQIGKISSVYFIYKQYNILSNCMSSIMEVRNSLFYFCKFFSSLTKSCFFTAASFYCMMLKMVPLVKHFTIELPYGAKFWQENVDKWHVEKSMSKILMNGILYLWKWL